MPIKFAAKPVQGFCGREEEDEDRWRRREKEYGGASLSSPSQKPSKSAKVDEGTIR